MDRPYSIPSKPCCPHDENSVSQDIASGVEDVASSLKSRSSLVQQPLIKGKGRSDCSCKPDSFFSSFAKNFKTKSNKNQQMSLLAANDMGNAKAKQSGISTNANLDLAMVDAGDMELLKYQVGLTDTMPIMTTHATVVTDKFSGMSVEAFPRVPCEDSHVYIKSTFGIVHSPGNGLHYYGDQWAALLNQQLSMKLLAQVIRYFKSFSAAELKLPPSLHPREIITAKVAAACLPLEGRPLTEQLASTQSRYLLAHFQLAMLHYEYTMTLQSQSEEDWTNSAEVEMWLCINDRLFLMSKHMKLWEQIYLKHAPLHTPSDYLSSPVVLEDGHDYKTLERLWPKIEGYIQRMVAGIKLCARIDSEEQMRSFFGDYMIDNGSCVSWGFLRKPFDLAYGHNWYEYINNCDNISTLSKLSKHFDSFVGLAMCLPPTFPPPLKCSECFIGYDDYFSCCAEAASKGGYKPYECEGQLINDSMHLRTFYLRVYVIMRTYLLSAQGVLYLQQTGGTDSDGYDQMTSWLRDGWSGLWKEVGDWVRMVSEADSDDHPLVSSSCENFYTLRDICAKYKELSKLVTQVLGLNRMLDANAAKDSDEADADSCLKGSDSQLLPASALENPVNEDKKRKKREGSKKKAITSEAISDDGGGVLLEDSGQPADSESTAQNNSNAACSVSTHALSATLTLESLDVSPVSVRGQGIVLSESLAGADSYGKLVNDSTECPSTSAQPASVMESPSYKHRASVGVSSVPLRPCNSPIVLDPVTDSKNVEMKSNGETLQQEATLAVDSAVDSIVGAKGPAAKLNNISVNSNVDAASLVSAGRGKQVEPASDAKIASENLPSGSVVGAVSRVPCAHSHVYVKPTSVVARKRANGLYFGDQWLDVVIAEKLSLVVIRKAIRYFESLSVDELKLPPSVHPREITSANVAVSLPLEGRPLAEQLARTQSRYLLALFQLAMLHCEYTMTVQLQSKKDWAGALHLWNNVNDRLFLMSKYMKLWELIYLKHTSQRTASDSLSSAVVLEDGHDYKTLEKLWPIIENYIRRMVVGMKVCALKVGDRELCAFLDAHQSNNYSCVTWSVLRKPKCLAYGRNWYHYICNCDSFSTLINLTEFFESFAGFQSRRPPLVPPPMQCSKCFCNYSGYFSNDSEAIFHDNEFRESYDGQLFMDSQLRSHHLPVYARLRAYSLAASTYAMWWDSSEEMNIWFREGVSSLGKLVSTWVQLLSEADSDDHPSVATADEDFDILQDIALRYNELYKTFVKVTSEPNAMLDAKAGKATDEANAESGTKSSESLFAPSSILNNYLDTQGKKKKKRNNKKKAVPTSDGVTDDVTLLADSSQLPSSNSTALQWFDGASSVSANDFSTAVIALESLDLSPAVSRLPNQLSDGAVAETVVGADCNGKAGSDGVESASVLEPLPSYKKHSSVAVSSSLLRQYECPICLEHLACAVTLLPCGDNFCYACIADYMNKSKTKRCPNCQSDQVNLTNTVPNRLAENTVQEILVQLGAEGEEQLTSWRRRADAGLEGRKRDIEAATAAAAAASVGGHGGKKKKNKKK